MTDLEFTQITGQTPAELFAITSLILTASIALADVMPSAKKLGERSKTLLQ